MSAACKILNKDLLHWTELNQELYKHILKQRSNKVVLLCNQYIIMLNLGNTDLGWQGRMIVFFTGHWIRMEMNIDFALGLPLQSLQMFVLFLNQISLPLSLNLCCSRTLKSYNDLSHQPSLIFAPISFISCCRTSRFFLINSLSHFLESLYMLLPRLGRPPPQL